MGLAAAALRHMTQSRQCVECGRDLDPLTAHPVCPACIFKRISDTGFLVASPSPKDEPVPSPIREGVYSGADFLEEYELLEEIGRGGMGVIYRAHQPRLNRTVAVKVVHAASLAGEEAIRRFHSEVRVAGRLNHPHIVRVFDVGVLDGCPCYSMEYLPHGSLAKRIHELNRNPSKAVDLIIKVAKAVYFAHQHGFLHRDLKPGNILLDGDFTPHVADFGLAKQLDSDSNITMSGSVLGSPSYMSPEQASGKTHELSVATDIYSIGTILYEALTGKPPFTAPTALETIRRVVEEDPSAPSSLAQRIDKDLETICLKCLEKNPLARYATAGALAEDLERWRRREPIHARPISTGERILKWTRRRPALAGVTLLLLLASMTGLGGVLYQWRQAERARQNESRQLRRAEAALARSSVALAEAALREGNTPAMQSALATVPADLRDKTWDYLQQESDTSRRVRPFHGKKITDLKPILTKPSHFAAIDTQGDCLIVDVAKDVTTRSIAVDLKPSEKPLKYSVALSPDGRWIAIGRNFDAGVVVQDIETGQTLQSLPTGATEELEFGPDGKTLLVVLPAREGIQLWEIESARQRWVVKDYLEAARFMPDGRRLLNYAWETQLTLLDVATGKPELDLSDNYFGVIAVHPGGELVVAGNPMGRIRAFDLPEGRLRFELQPHENIIQFVAFLPGAEQFLTAATLSDRRLALQCWDARTGHHCKSLTGGRGDIRIAALHPRSGELVLIADEASVWDTVRVAPLKTFKNGNPHPSAVFWGDDDTLFAPGPTEGSAVLQQIAGESTRVLWKPETMDHGQPSVSADGHRAAISRYDSVSTIVVLERKDAQLKTVCSFYPRDVFNYLRLSPSGDVVAVVTRAGSDLELHDVAANKELVRLDARGIVRFNDIVWLDSGKTLVGLVTSQKPRNMEGSIEEIISWDASTGKRLQVVTNATLSSVGSASLDGKRFAEAGSDRNVRIRDAATLQVLMEFRAHNGPISALAWHPRRPVLATASEDLSLRLWNLETGKRLEELQGSLAPPNVLSFSPGGFRLATAARDGVARIWAPLCLQPAP